MSNDPTSRPLPRTRLRPLLLSPASAGRLCDYSARQMRTFAAEGIVPFVRLPRARGIRFRLESLRKLAAEHETVVSDRKNEVRIKLTEESFQISRQPGETP